VVTGGTENDHILSGTTLWNIDTGTDRRLTCTAITPAFCFSRDAASLVETEVIDGPLRVIDLATGEKRVTFGRALGHNYSCLDGSIAFSPDGQILVACSMDDGLVMVWSTSSGQVRAVYEVPGADVVCFSPDSTLLVVRPLCDTSFQRVLSYVIKDQVWLNRLCPPTSHTVLLDAHTGRRKALLPHADYLAFAPDGKTLVTYSEIDDAILFWDVLPKTGLRRPGPWLALVAAVFVSVWWWRARRSNSSVS